ncbi:hypothetical protein OO256_15245 [Pseudomonas sp. DCB_CB]|uniref:hypothetical protein n=1 Tax=Pseudomonas TaxID=286 RepID=UPI000C2A5BEB|nr:MULTISPECIES: hypothetical protein [Pseudomonas]MCX2692072.1 hypothetical protein [Pseudomonas sp. DCB_BZ]MCX2857448.1 hypothetical protein [Pseudomonas sp. DCB_CB]MDH1694245.1 hypothetical protein [Pseudomonas sp. GD03766]PJX10322.1 hypothetical protein CQW32_10105 [Pseudomonas putida]
MNKFFVEHKRAIEKKIEEFAKLDSETLISNAKNSKSSFDLFATSILIKKNHPEHSSMLSYRAMHQGGWQYYALQQLMKGNYFQAHPFSSTEIVQNLLARFDYREALFWLNKNKDTISNYENLALEVTDKLIESGDLKLARSIKNADTDKIHKAQEKIDAYELSNPGDFWFSKIRKEINEGRGALLLALVMKRLEKNPSDESALTVLKFKNYSIRNFLNARRIAFRENPSDTDLLLSLVECLCVYKFHDEAHNILKPVLLTHLECSNASKVVKRSLYELFIRLEDTFQETPRTSPLIGSKEAIDLDLADIRGLDLLSVTSQCYWRLPSAYPDLRDQCINEITDHNARISNVLTEIERFNPTSQPANLNVITVISGQIRGLTSVKSSLDRAKTLGDLAISTWDKEGVMSTQLGDLSRVFNKAQFAAIPSEFRQLRDFASFFPSAMEKIQTVAPSFTSITSRETLATCADFKEIYIEPEAAFHSEYSGDAHLFVNGNMNQAKMFYKINKGFDSHVDTSKNSIVIRQRCDLSINIDQEVLEDCFEKCLNNRSLIYVPYYTVYGCNDQFALGSTTAMAIYSSLWKQIKSFGFKYSSLFNEITELGAEHLLANHLYAHGIQTKIIPTIENRLVSARVASEVINIKHEISRDFIHLHADHKRIFRKFYELFCA